MIESSSNMTIPQEHHYIISVVIQKTTTHELNCKKLCEFASTEILRGSVNHKPLLTYYYDDKIIAVFSCSNDRPHYMNGSYCKILSQWCSNFVLKLQTHVECNIIQFETKTRLLMYIMHEVYNNQAKTFLRLGEGFITEKDVVTLTEGELKSKLESKGIHWKSLTLKEKYGVFYKLTKKNNHVSAERTSMRPSASKMEAYRTLVFG